MTRLKSHIWVSAYLTRLRLIDVPAFVVAKGDADAGAVFIKLNTLNGQAQLFQRRFDLITGDRVWDRIAQGPETAIDDALSAQRRTDPDLWVIEVEDRQGRHLLDAPGLS